EVLGWQRDCRALGDKRALDCPIDPPTCIRAKPRPLSRVKSPDCFHQTNVSFRDQISQRQTKVDVISGNGYDEPQVRMNHPFASCCIAVPDFASELDFVIGG